MQQLIDSLAVPSAYHGPVNGQHRLQSITRLRPTLVSADKLVRSTYMKP